MLSRKHESFAMERRQAIKEDAAKSDHWRRESRGLGHRLRIRSREEREMIR